MLMLSELAISELKYAKVTENQIKAILESDQVQVINDYVENNSFFDAKASNEEEAFYKFMRSHYSVVPAQYISETRDLIKKVGNQEVLCIDLGKRAKNHLYFFGKFNMPELHDVSEVKTNEGTRTITKIKDKLYIHYYCTDYSNHYFVQLDQHKLNDDNTIDELNHEEVDKEFVVYYPPVTKAFALHYCQVEETFEDIKKMLDKKK